MNNYSVFFHNHLTLICVILLMVTLEITGCILDLLQFILNQFFKYFLTVSTSRHLIIYQFYNILIHFIYSNSQSCHCYFYLVVYFCKAIFQTQVLGRQQTILTLNHAHKSYYFYFIIKLMQLKISLSIYFSAPNFRLLLIFNLKTICDIYCSTCPLAIN